MSYTESNDASRARLEAFVRGLTDEELRRPVAYGGGTVAALLAHVALFDRRVTVLLRRWTAAGAVDDSPLDPDMINDSVAPSWRRWSHGRRPSYACGPRPRPTPRWPPCRRR